VNSRPEAVTGTRKARKLATRRRLLEAAMDLILADGMGALTTGRIAAGAGIAQSGFYVHFDNLDALLAALGGEAVGEVVDMEAALRRERLAGLEPEAMLRDACERMHIVLSHCLQHPRETQLMLRCRLDPTPLGEGIRRALRRAERLVVQDLWDVAAGLGLRGAYLPQVEIVGAMLVHGVLGALELCVLADGPDVDAVARALGSNQYHFAGAELYRLCAEQAERDGAQ
jgi:AcrR family transcriptional regulator